MIFRITSLIVKEISISFCKIIIIFIIILRSFNFGQSLLVGTLLFRIMFIILEFFIRILQLSMIEDMYWSGVMILKLRCPKLGIFISNSVLGSNIKTKLTIIIVILKEHFSFGFIPLSGGGWILKLNFSLVLFVLIILIIYSVKCHSFRRWLLGMWLGWTCYYIRWWIWMRL